MALLVSCFQIVVERKFWLSQGSFFATGHVNRIRSRVILELRGVNSVPHETVIAIVVDSNRRL